MADDGQLVTYTDEAGEEALRAIFPHGLPANRAPVRSNGPFVRSFPLTADSMRAYLEHKGSAEVLGVGQPTLQSIKRRHHRLAMMMAAGIGPVQAAAACGIVPSTVALLQRDPLFAQLLDMYSDGVSAEFRDTVIEMRELADDVVALIRDKLDHEGMSLSVPQLQSLLATLTDRTGNGPSSTSNIRAQVAVIDGATLERIKAGATALSPVGRQVPRLAEADRAAIEGVAGAAPVVDGQHTVVADCREGPGVRAQGAEAFEGELFGEDDDGAGDLA